jgi:broad specificity phosphatase PhoE
MPALILVKHSLPEVDPNVTPSRWLLSDERCQLLAEKLAAYQPDVVVASLEPKATETGQIVAVRLGLPFEMAEDLHEHDRSNVRYVGRTEFESAVAAFFAQPGQLVLGQETAEQAQRRFTQAVVGIVEKQAGKNVVIVTHGTVISLFVSSTCGIQPFDIWQRLELPSFVVLSTPAMTLVDEIDRVV